MKRFPSSWNVFQQSTNLKLGETLFNFFPFSLRPLTVPNSDCLHLSSPLGWHAKQKIFKSTSQRKLFKPYDADEKLIRFFPPLRAAVQTDWTHCTHFWVIKKKHERAFNWNLKVESKTPHLQAAECNKTVKVSNKATLTNIVFGEQPDSCADDSVPKAKLIQAPEYSQVGLSVVLEFEAKENRPTAPCEINYYNPLKMHTQTQSWPNSCFFRMYHSKLYGMRQIRLLLRFQRPWKSHLCYSPHAGNPSLAQTHQARLSRSCTVCFLIVVVYPGLCEHFSSHQRGRLCYLAYGYVCVPLYFVAFVRHIVAVYKVLEGYHSSVTACISVGGIINYTFDFVTVSTN